ncbi:HpcH/HpaI aldolase/citrate lyase family protein [Serratia rubidaea]|uniref:HpcH/HpaI aldolase/citrate lyase family protein n=1 Tax=Serratia rubidaea TaxID=61652 RepID=A0ABS0MEA6_SERRU|nr:HpcH/HpaI aldolase/citrate lyase family protein [Serratia rubidaea]MBH1930711.1 HpcH/HpaI aldolase/citrate lyase family protein [Serratia rubidaea]MDC6116631.1 HpcH/HpaI aldolase/citrate lyase family protein [Serratia rubidaea]
MIHRLSPWNLGATLYMPATRTDIADAVIRGKIPGLRSLIICLEDAVSDADIPLALQNLKQLMQELNAAKAAKGNDGWPLVFIRPRHEEMGKRLIEQFDLTAADGMVLPKFTLASLPAWWTLISDTHLCLMPTLETAEVFDLVQMRELATTLVSHPCRGRIIALRIGGNDLMNVISLRRPRNLTLYDGPMGYVIKMLVAVFGPQGFSLTAPVCEHIDDYAVMTKELSLDISHGLVGKTAIHPEQIGIIEQALMVSADEHADALRILNTTQAVFKSQGAMCEPATHRRWAAGILKRAGIYGLYGEQGGSATAVDTSALTARRQQPVSVTS